MEQSTIVNKMKTSLMWKFLERIVAQGISFVISIIIARILQPSDYGAITLVLSFVSLANIFITSGFNTALIQKKDVDEKDFSTIFYFNLIISIILYLFLYFFAPIIANFYENIELIKIIRILSLIIPISSLNVIQQAHVMRNLNFKKFFLSTLIGNCISGVVGIIMAYLQCGVWALVAQSLIAPIINTLVLLVTVPWRPKLLFSIKSLKDMIGYSSRITLATLVSTAYMELRGLIIGRIYTSADLAYYKKGNVIPDIVVNNVDTTMGSVLFPTLSKCSENKEAMKSLMRKNIKISSYIISPVLVGLFVVAEPLIEVLLTEKWLLAVPFMQIACISQLTMPISTTNNQAIKATGRSDIFLKMEASKKVIGVIIILAVMNISVEMIALSIFPYGIIAILINTFPSKKMFDYGIIEQFKDLLPIWCISLIMGLVTYMILFLNLSIYATLIIQVIVGITIYCGVSECFKLDEYKYLKENVRKVVGKFGENFKKN